MRRAAAASLLAVAWAAGSGWARPVAFHGVVEGYYGRPWSGEARREVIRFLGARGMNAFLYGPKNDDFHRARWREPYPPSALADLRATVRAAREARVRFIYGLSPVLDVCYSCRDDQRALRRKLHQLARVRVRHFALLFDDGGQLTDPADVARYGGADGAALARAQADLTNRTHRWLRARGLGRVLLIVPSEYWGTTCTPYHAELARRLRRGMPVAWTGPGVFAARITAADVAAFGACLPRHPLVLWDNYPVNDTVLAINLHLGPLTGRDAALVPALRGYLLNPMTQAHASMIPLATAAAFLAAPEAYDPEVAWEAALADFGGGGDGLAVLAAQVRSSALDLRDARELAARVDKVTTTWEGAAWAPAVDALALELVAEGAAPADIAAHLGATPLGAEIAPWVEELAAHSARGLEAVELLRALKPALLDVVSAPVGATVRVRGRALPPDADVAAALGPGFVDEAAAVAARIADPPFVALLGCLGSLFGADITFCRAFGLNVHGKALYLVIRTPADVSLVADANVHDRLLLFAGSAHAAWSARRGPGADELTLTLGGDVVPLAPDGAFDVTTAFAREGLTLLLTTAAGEATQRPLPP